MKPYKNSNSGRNRLATTITVLCCNIAAIGCSAGSAWYCHELSEGQGLFQEASMPECVAYIGLNDRDTHTQLRSTEECAEIINRICKKYVDGYSYSQIAGSWKQDDGEYIEENTLAYQFMDADEEVISRIMDEVMDELNQVCVLTEYRGGSYRYYYSDENEESGMTEQ